MGKNRIGVIIAREFSVRVKKKSFIVITLLTPLLLAGLLVVPALISLYSGDRPGQRVIQVADRSGVVLPYLERDSTMRFVAVPEDAVDMLKAGLAASKVYALLEISPLDSARNVTIQAYAASQIDRETRSHIQHLAGKAVEEYKIKASGIPELDRILQDLQTRVKIKTFRIDEKTGQEKTAQAEAFMAVGYAAGFMIYMFIFLFGNMVMRSVIEEKTTRIVEVIVTTVKPFQLMMGKILGVAAVALTQFVIWIVLTLAIVTGVAAAVGGTESAAAAPQAAQQWQSLPEGTPQELAGSLSGPDVAGRIGEALQGIDLPGVIGCFVIYFVLGYLLYAGMFAAVGSSVDSEADTQHLVQLVSAPAVIGLFIMLHTFQYPDSSVSFWGSMIPFTSPIVMVTRAAYGVPGWQIAVSLLLLAGTFAGMTCLSGRIYRTGILTYGRRATWKDWMMWIKKKN